ncbi:MAG: antitoxin VapB family protein [Candidatus Aenigmatarchaeota archaeon]
MAATKRIRISEENRKLLHQMKDVGQSYDEVIEELLKEHWEKNRGELFNKIEENEEKAPEGFTSLEELD